MSGLKDYRDNELKYYVIGNILLILFLSGTLNELLAKELNDIMDIISVVIQSALLSSIIYIYVFLFDSIISGNNKLKIAYLFLGKLPGYTIFSDMEKKLKDDRFTWNDVVIKYKEIYENMPQNTNARQKYENAKWYKIYRKHEKAERVYTANRDFLLCRDMAISSLLLIIMYITSTVFLGFWGFNVLIIKILICEFVLTDIAMRNKASRLAYNVIADDIYT